MRMVLMGLELRLIVDCRIFKVLISWLGSIQVAAE
nr:MAG TPA: hypothetical protein [Caudoviricetes sp.]